MIVYSAICSLDGYVADADGKFDWAAPDEEVHAFVNELERPVGTYLYGRRMYETMRFWDTAHGSGATGEYAEIWRAADKVVYSRTLDEVSTARTRIERELDPEAVRAMDGIVSVGGAELAGQAIAAGVVDECHLLLTPVVVGGGTRALPDGVRWDLELVAERRFARGVVHLHYRAKA